MAVFIYLSLLLLAQTVFCKSTSKVQQSVVWDGIASVRDRIAELIALLQETMYRQFTYADPLTTSMGMLINSPSLGYSYLLMVDYKNWEDARQYCINKGYHLAWIESMKEQSYIANIIKANPDLSNLKAGPWIGGTDLGHDGCWVWSAPKIRSIAGAFTHWHEGEPNNYGNSEDCMQMDSRFDYKWNDMPCSEELPFVCKRAIGTFVVSSVTTQMIKDTPVCDRKTY